MNNQKRGFAEGEFAATQFGAGFQANPGSSRSEYLDSAAWYFGKESFSQLTAEEKSACRGAFQVGINKERLSND